MKKANVLVMVLACGSLALGQSAKVGWSLGYYCGWNQAGFPPAQINWKAFTHIAHFTVFPNADGSLDFNSYGLTDAHCKAAVAEAHKHGVKILVSFGGAGVKDRFKGACSPANIHTFVKNMLNFMRKYGYDGIDTDWEEDFDDGMFLAWHKELRDSLNKMSPRPLFTIAGAGYLAAHCAQAWPYVDQMNTMSYGFTASGLPADIEKLTSRGVPKAKIGVGLGISPGGAKVDVDSNISKAKVLYALNNGMGGIMAWSVLGSTRHIPIFKMMEQFIPANPVGIWAGPLSPRADKISLFVGGNKMTGLQEIRYSVSRAAGSRGSVVDLSLFDLHGSFLRRLAGGYSEPGAYVIPLQPKQGGGTALPPGTYIVRLAAGAETETAIARPAP